MFEIGSSGFDDQKEGEEYGGADRSATVPPSQRNECGDPGISSSTLPGQGRDAVPGNAAEIRSGTPCAVLEGRTRIAQEFTPRESPPPTSHFPLLPAAALGGSGEEGGDSLAIAPTHQKTGGLISRRAYGTVDPRRLSVGEAGGDATYGSSKFERVGSGAK